MKGVNYSLVKILLGGYKNIQFSYLYDNQFSSFTSSDFAGGNSLTVAYQGRLSEEELVGLRSGLTQFFGDSIKVFDFQNLDHVSARKIVMEGTRIYAQNERSADFFEAQMRTRRYDFMDEEGRHIA